MKSGELKDLFSYGVVPEGEGWKLELLRDMLWDRQEMLYRGEGGGGCCPFAVLPRNIS